MAKRRFSDEIRDAVATSGKTRRSISKGIGISQPAMSRFMHGGGLELANIDRLAKVLGLHVVKDRGKRA